MRYAIYFTPDAADPLTEVAARWLGRDAFGGAPLERGPVRGLDAPTVDRWTDDARRYGFHATVMAPFQPVPETTEAAMIAALESFAARAAPVEIPRAIVRRHHGFFALVPAEPHDGLNLLETATRAAFDALRTPPTEGDVLKRAATGLTDRQIAYLRRHGYPYVLEFYAFHMTLTGRVPDALAPVFEAELKARFAAHDGAPLVVDRLALFVEPEPGAPFTVAHVSRLAGVRSAGVKGAA
jgi:hypothetical protein